tara:strand:- start:1149 stop:1448 length:300 start_codon:yes stop_codon:yes gene_type:complete
MSKELSLDELRRVVYNLDGTINSKMDKIAADSQRIISDANLPKNPAEMWERYPPKAVADSRDYYPYIVTQEDKFWIWATALFYPFLILFLISVGALLDF